LQLLVDRRVASEDSASAPAHIHHKEGKQVVVVMLHLISCTC